MSQDFTGQLIKETYQRVVQVSGSTTKYLLDGTGSLIQNLELKNAVLSGSTDVSGSLIFQPQDPDYIAGQLYYNNTEYTLDFQTGIDAVTLQIGQENFVRARNATGATITNGQAVRISGVQGNRPKVDLAISTIDWGAQRDSVEEILGIATHDIPNNTDGFITTFGLVRNVDTSAYTNGDLLYLSNTTSGSYSTTAPPVPYDNIFIGTVINSSATQGIIFANPREAIHLHDISHISQSIKPSVNQLLGFNGSYWERFSNKAFERDGNGDIIPVTGSFYDTFYELDSNEDIVPKDLPFWLDANGDIVPLDPDLTNNIQTRKTGISVPGDFSGSPLTATITFTTAFPNTSYAVFVNGGDSRVFTVESKTTTGFTINTNSSVGLSNDVYWDAKTVGEFV